MKKIESLPPHNFLLLFSLLKKNKTKFTSLEVKTHILQKKCATSPPHICMYRHSLRIFFRKAIFICIFQIQIKYFFYNLKVSFRCELISFFFASFAEFRTVLCTIVAIVFTSNTHIPKYTYEHIS